MTDIHIQPLKNPITTAVNLPGCIGYTIRALNIAAMTKGSICILRPLKSDDTYAMVGALRTLGIEVEEGKDFFTVHGDIYDIREADYEINIGLSGRSARTLLALLSIVPGQKIITCKEPFKKRPIGDLVDGLRQLGADISYLEKEGHLPVAIKSQKLESGVVRMSGKLSSQYFSAIMMIAPMVGDITIEVMGGQSSRPFIDMTIDIMNVFGISVENNVYKTYKIQAQAAYKNPKTYEVEPEATSASYFFAIAALTKSSIKVLNLSPDSVQGDLRFVDTLEAMGCKVRKNLTEKWVEVTGTDTLKGIRVDMNAAPDLVPTLAVVAAFAKGPTTITNIAHARLKETDRIASPAQELAKMKIRTDTTQDSLTIYGGEPKSAVIETYHDHRMAMAFAVAGTKVSGMIIKHPEVVGKSFPEFWDVLADLSAEKNIILTGMRGSGKSTIGHIVAKRLGRKFINMDEILEQRAGMLIRNMVDRHGWDYFRDQESQLAHDLANERRAVISTGGGIILRPGNVEALKTHGLFVFLDASLDMLEHRLKDETSSRPALTAASNLPEELEIVWNKREGLYKKTADIRVATDNHTPADIAAEIIQNIRRISE